MPTCDVQEMLYPFPKEKGKYEAWLKAIGYKSKKVGWSLFKPGYLGVCGDHFKPEDFTIVEGKDKPTLNPEAIPVNPYAKNPSGKRIRTRPCCVPWCGPAKDRVHSHRYLTE